MIDALGLTPAEEAVYLLLLDAASLTASELAGSRDATEDAIAGALARLQSQGLVTSLAGTPVRYAALDPRVGLKGLVTAREQQLRRAEAAASALTARFDGARRGRNPLDVIEVAIGEQPIGDRFQQMQAAARREILGMDLPPYVDDSPNTDELHHLARGVVHRTLYDTTCLQDPTTLSEVRQLQRAGEDVRVLTGVPFKLVVADRQVALLALTGGPGTPASCLIVHPSALLDGLLAAFDTLWRLAGTLSIPADPSADTCVDPGPPAGTPSRVERELLTLTNLGLTDKAIARQLGVSERTVQRMMSAIMKRLAAGTRFQAGVRARELDWF